MKSKFLIAAALGSALSAPLLAPVEAAAQTSSLQEAFVLNGVCNKARDRFFHPVEVETLADSGDKRMWFGRHVWTHMFSGQFRPMETHPDSDNVIRVHERTNDIRIEYDIKARLGHATMSAETFAREFANHSASGHMYIGQWSCRLQPQNDAAIIPHLKN